MAIRRDSRSLPGLVNHGGHTVIVTGFRSDPTESTGGYFMCETPISIVLGFGRKCSIT